MNLTEQTYTDTFLSQKIFSAFYGANFGPICPGISIYPKLVLRQQIQSFLTYAFLGLPSEESGKCGE